MISPLNITDTAVRRRWLGALAVLPALALTVVASTAEAGGKRSSSHGKPPLRAMTRNLYLGADLTPALAATTQLELALAGTQIWNTVLATDFPARAKVLAREIARAKPDLIGLQEAAIWRTGIPDGPPVLGGTAATDVQFDYLQILLDELSAIRRPYVVVISQEEADIESITASGFDVRLTQRDVILARERQVQRGKLSCTNEVGAHYPSAIQLSVPLLGGLAVVESTRGYVAADCIFKWKQFRFVNTHLEAFSAGLRAQQAAFLAEFGPASTVAQPVILVGDINSDPNDTSIDPPDPTPNNTAFNVLTQVFGFVDTWVQANGGDPGFTFGFNEFVNDPDASGFDARIDHVLTRPTAKVRKSRVTGTDPRNRTPAGLWPSDHAGVVAKLSP